jgi:hypothetical protein
VNLKGIRKAFGDNKKLQVSSEEENVTQVITLLRFAAQKDTKKRYKRSQTHSPNKNRSHFNLKEYT